MREIERSYEKIKKVYLLFEQHEQSLFFLAAFLKKNKQK